MKFIILNVVTSCIFLSYVKLSLQEKLNISLYYESLCPDCKEFDKYQLFPTYKKIGQYFTLDLVPYGNAKREKVGDKWKFTCQHGKNECYGNKVHACVLSSANIDYDRKVRFVGCSMSSDNPSSSLVNKKCADELSLEWNIIDKCASSEQGDNLLAQYGLETDSLVPKHTYVPWLLFNGVHNETVNDEAIDNFFKVVCNFLENKPKQCVENQHEISLIHI